MKLLLNITLNLFNFFGLGNLKICGEVVRVSRIWFIVNILRMILIHIPNLWSLIYDEMYFEIYQKSDDADSFTSTTRMYVLFRVLFIIEFLGIVYLNVNCCFFRRHEIVKLFSRIRHFPLNEQQSMKMIRKIRRFFVAPILVTFFNLWAFSSAWNLANSSVFYTIFGAIFGISNSTYAVFSFLLKITEIYAVNLIDQINFDFFNTEHLCTKYSMVLELMAEFQKIFNSMITFTVTRTYVYHVLDVSN